LRRSLAVPVWSGILAALLVIGAPILAQQSASASLLNSERIEQTFGSYGIDVLYGDATLRVSRLYSTDDGHKTLRTLALVSWPDTIDATIAGLHERILAGESIGATFKSAGFTVVKDNVYYGLIVVTPRMRQEMRLATDGPAAIHVYDLAVEREGRRVEYARIAELHHPDYLSRADLTRIYGPVASAGANAETIRRFVDDAVARFERGPVQP